MKIKNQTDLEIMEDLVFEYIQENEVSPFVDIQSGEDTNTLQIDMDKEFENNLEKEITGSLEDVVGEFFTNLFKDIIENEENKGNEENPES